jgi:hypothetical protein
MLKLAIDFRGEIKIWRKENLPVILEEKEEKPHQF